jgi:hypothetical protein
VSVNYPISIINGRLQLALNVIDGGASNGFMRLLDSGGNILSTLQLARPSAVIANGVMTFQGMSLIDPSAAGTGQAVGARFEDSAGNVAIFGLTIGSSVSADIVMTPNNQINAGETVAVTAATIIGQ